MPMAPASGIVDAVKNGDIGRVRALLEQDPRCAAARDAEGVAVVLSACYQGKRALMNLLLGAQPELDIFAATAIGRADRVQELLRAEAGLATAFAADGFTALQLAASFGHTAAAQVLLDCGAEVKAVARNSMQVMVLRAAVSNGHTEVCELLVARGAEVNARQQQGWTPLHGAAQNGDEPLVRLLLALGALAGLPMDDGRTAAEIAASAGHADLARRLAALNGEARGS
jgi:ankyrin repeat protein